MEKQKRTGKKPEKITGQRLSSAHAPTTRSYGWILSEVREYVRHACLTYG